MLPKIRRHKVRERGSSHAPTTICVDWGGRGTAQQLCGNSSSVSTWLTCSQIDFSPFLSGAAINIAQYTFNVPFANKMLHFSVLQSIFPKNIFYLKLRISDETATKQTLILTSSHSLLSFNPKSQFLSAFIEISRNCISHRFRISIFSPKYFRSCF